MSRPVTDKEMQAEIERLRKSPNVKLARKADKAKYTQQKRYNAERQKLYTLRYLEKKGRQLSDDGYTLDDFDMSEPPPFPGDY